MSALLNYIIESLLMLLLFIALILFFTIGVSFWYVCYPIFIIIYYIKNFNKTQEKYKYDLKFWIESLNILDAVLVISYIISLSLYFAFTEFKYLCFYINIGSFVLYLLNNESKSRYFVNHSIFALPYVDFTKNKRYIIGKIKDIIKYDLYPEDIELLSDLKTNSVTVHTYDNDELRNSASRLAYHQFAIKHVIDDSTYSISINNELLPYLKGDTNESSNIFS
jgi:hypothetical protein